jgi:hypothetical protein
MLTRRLVTSAVTGSLHGGPARAKIQARTRCISVASPVRTIRYQPIAVPTARPIASRIEPSSGVNDRKIRQRPTRPRSRSIQNILGDPCHPHRTPPADGRRSGPRNGQRNNLTEYIYSHLRGRLTTTFSAFLGNPIREIPRWPYIVYSVFIVMHTQDGIGISWVQRSAIRGQ